MKKRLKGRSFVALVPVVLSLPLVLAIVIWNLYQADRLTLQWSEQEAREELKEILVDYQPQLRNWLSEPQEFAKALATESLLAAGVFTSGTWSISGGEPWARLLQDTIPAASFSFRLLPGQVGFLRLPLRAGPPTRGRMGGGQGRGFGFRGGRSSFEDPEHQDESGTMSPMFQARGPFEVAVLFRSSRIPPVWPLRLQSVFWILAWLAGSLLWGWLWRTQQRIRRMAIERQREAHLAAVGRMSARLAHEIRNPLGMIRGAAQHLQKAQLPSGQQELLEMVEQESRRLEHLTRGILDFCRPPEVHPTPVDLVPLLRFIQTQANLITDLPPVTLGPVPDSLMALADADSLRQVLLNLLQNARQASVGRTGPPVSIEVKSGGADPVLRIRDHGPGMSPEAREHLFEPFFSDKPQGFGLGLAISRRLVELMNGTLRLVNHPDGGCLAEVQLPHA